MQLTEYSKILLYTLIVACLVKKCIFFIESEGLLLCSRDSDYSNSHYYVVSFRSILILPKDICLIISANIFPFLITVQQGATYLVRYISVGSSHLVGQLLNSIHDARTHVY